ncbi:alpha-ketoglutarate decarboxylase [Nonlabens ponticola]|uniref:Alpha-ketoglutarate decarboxylase n=1 Tax=Nonlabens ponticola TaxID=2496866 RepID=A0A3S9MUS7_9FLAO|nr:alpha-ketoglutarate decarboxylase [Nonlabens ponticola]AZQ42935.1 alpha-ketoglutarate decarboxylase [Nonlabens ponticola]
MKNISTYVSLLFVFCFFAGCHFTSAQNIQQDGSDFWQRVRYGGNIGLNFSNGYKAVQLAPQAIYQVNPQVGVGVGLNGSYVKRNFNGDNRDFSSTILGGSLISIYQPIEFIQVSTDFELLHVNQNFEDDVFRDENYWVPALFLGAGYATGNVVFGARYDLLYNEGRSIYRNGLQPFVRVLF